MRGKLWPVVVLVVVTAGFVGNAQAQGIWEADPYFASRPLYPAGVAAALRLRIPLGEVDMRAPTMLTFTAGAGPEWQDWGRASYFARHPHGTPTIMAGISFSGPPVLLLGNIDLLAGRKIRVDANAEEGPVGDGRLVYAVLGVLAAGGIAGLVAGDDGGDDKGPQPLPPFTGFEFFGGTCR